MLKKGWRGGGVEGGGAEGGGVGKGLTSKSRQTTIGVQRRDYRAVLAA